MILSGSVSVTLTNYDGIEYTLATLGKGEIFLAGGIFSLRMLKILAARYEFTKSIYRIHQVILIPIMLLFLYL